MNKYVAPDGLGVTAKALWDWLVDFEPDEHEIALIREAVRTVDLCNELDAIVTAEGAVIDSPQGRKAHPAAVEARQQRITLARLISALRLPEDEEDQVPVSRRAQRRFGARGTYDVSGRAA